MWLMDRVWRRGCWLAFGIILTASASAGAESTEHADVRVLIDISGSMRQNDPDNLRRPALRMLSGLLQPGTRAGVWTFARWVNNLVPVAEVDAAWKQRTQSLSEQIASPGQFTNIEEVLDRASRDWEGQPPSHARHLVLLTDGMVDVAKVAGENAQSRARILEQLLPRLQAAGVKVHTIALSARADHDLMKRLAGETGGWYQQVAQADELQRVFLRMFEQVGAPDMVPLQDNRFTVDGAVTEATVLVFSRPGAEAVVLHSPSGQRYTDSDLPSGVAWFRDQGYDMITLASPEKGEWRLQADVDPDNRVMVVTDLKLQTSEVPTHLAVGEPLRIEASLSNRGELVTRKAFLRLLEVRADRNTAAGSEALILNDDGGAPDEQAADGRYAMAYSEAEAQQSVELVVAVDSPTFMRQKRFHLVVHEPAEATVEGAADGPLLAIRAQRAVMQDGASVEAWQRRADGQIVPLALQPGGEGEWNTALVDGALPSYVKVSGTSRLGNLVERTIGPVMAPGLAVPPLADPVEEPVTAAPQAEAATAVDEPPAEPVTAAEEPPPADEDWTMPAILFGGVNLLLLVGGGAWFFLRRRRGGEGETPDLEDLIDESATAKLEEDAA
jgi:uncharacterized protein (TIGR03503 family)